MASPLLCRHPFAAFIILAFLLSFGLGFAAHWISAVNGWRSGSFLQNQFFTLLVVSGPALAAAMVVRATGGSGAVSDWLKADWQRTEPRYWWCLVPVATLAIASCAYVLAGIAPRDIGSALTAGWPLLFAYYAIQICMVGLLEETGWRGWLLRRRLETGSPLQATLFVALVWGLWHAPKLLGDWRFAVVFAGAILVNSLLLTICWARLRGGIALAAIAHGSFNAPLFFFSDQLQGKREFDAFVVATLIYGIFALALVLADPAWWTRRPVRLSSQTQ